MTTDLIALLVEITSIGLTGAQLKKPIRLPRPNDRKPSPRRTEAITHGETDAAFKQGISVLAATTKAVTR